MHCDVKSRDQNWMEIQPMLYNMKLEMEYVAKQNMNLKVCKCNITECPKGVVGCISGKCVATLNSGT